MENSDKGYEVGGLAIWYHPFRLDMYPGLREKQLKNLRTRLAEDRGGRDIPDSAMQHLVSSAIREDDAKRRPGDSQNVNNLKLIRGHHMQNGGVVYDMAKLARTSRRHGPMA